MSRARRRATAYRAVRMRHRFPWRPSAAGALVCGVGAVGDLALGLDAIGDVLYPVGPLTAVACGGWWWVRHVARPHSAKALIARRTEIDARNHGVATRLDLAEHTSRTALRLQATVLRPSLADLSWWQRRWLDPRELGVLIAQLGWGLWGEQVWSSCEDATLRIGGPRTGKTLSLACHGLDAPGALITTSTRLDVAEHVHQMRAARGRVWVFNPSNLGNPTRLAEHTTAVRWSVLAGCRDFTTARRRASDLIPPSGQSSEGERWDAQARRILALFLHAAALSGRSMRDVVRWTADPTDTNRAEVLDALHTTTPPGTTADTGPREAVHGDVEVLDPEGAQDRATSIRAFYNTNDRTLTSITTTMATPLAWMSDRIARRLGDAPLADPGLFDVRGLIERGETLHLLGHEETDAASPAPLIAALVAEIAYTCRTLASRRRGGRLDPPVTLLLDEAALVCPVPLERWTADMGGRGVTIHISVQSLAQLRQRWGVENASAILANTGCFVVFGGSPAASDLQDLSVLTGEHHTHLTPTGREPTTTSAKKTSTPLGSGPAGDGTPTRWAPVMTAAQIRALAPGQVLVLRRGIPALVADAPRITDRHRWRTTDLTTDHPTPTTPRRARTRGNKGPGDTATRPPGGGRVIPFPRRPAPSETTTQTPSADSGRQAPTDAELEALVNEPTAGRPTHDPDRDHTDQSTGTPGGHHREPDRPAPSADEHRRKDRPEPRPDEGPW